MLDTIAGMLRHHPEVTFFFVLGIGYLLGKLRLGSFTLGAVPGTLLAGVAVGQMGVEVSEEVRQIFLLLFLFSTGFRTGPQFFRGLKSDGIQQGALAAIVATSGLVVAYAMSRLLGYDPGTAAGVIAGSMTQSAAIGTASDAIARLPLPPAEITAMTNRVAIAYAVTYLIGVVGTAWFLAQLAPRLLRIDLAEECRRYEEKMQGVRETSSTARREIEYRAYAVQPGSPLIGRRARDLERVAAEDRLFIERMRRGGRVFDPDEDTAVEAGDILAITGRRERMVPKLDEQRLGLREVDDQDLLAIPAETLDIVVTRSDVDGRTLADLAADEAFRSVYLRAIRRAGTPVPVFPATTVQRGDVLTVAGPSRRVAQAVERLGVPDRVTDVTDMVLVALGIVAGALIGIPAVRWAGIEIGLSLSVGVLLGGLVCGWLRSMWPRFFGRIPGPTLWVFESVGLAGFVAVVGLDAGPDFVVGLRTSGVSLLLAGLATATVPHVIGICLGRWVFKMPVGVMLGVCAGGGTATPALAAIQESAKSPVPTLGYGVAYAVGNVLLALWGSVIVALM
ncbi:MAG TPA: aspartate-alanine antiporter [Thermoanaerobaculia bacterium]